MPDKELIARMAELWTAGSIASIGGVAHYFYKYSQGMPFRFVMFVVNVFLAWFVGILVGMVFPDSVRYRDAIISISGFSSLHILGFIENGGWRIIMNAALRAFGLSFKNETWKTASEKSMP